MKTEGWLLNSYHSVSESGAELELNQFELPEFRSGWVQLRVLACGLCHTDLDEIEGRVRVPYFPMVLGHQVVGIVEEITDKNDQGLLGKRVGVSWYFASCGKCQFCFNRQPNLCSQFQATGRDYYGGYARIMRVPASSVFLLPEHFPLVHLPPLLCAGAVGYRAWLLMTQGIPVTHLGLMGYGVCAYWLSWWLRACHPHVKIFVFARREESRRLAKEVGVEWVGTPTEFPPVLMDAILDTTPAWGPVLFSLNYLRPGGRLVINAIAKEEEDKKFLIQLSYRDHLWMEKEIKTVANITPQDIQNYLDTINKLSTFPIVSQVYAFDELNRALRDLKFSRGVGSKILMVV